MNDFDLGKTQIEVPCSCDAKVPVSLQQVAEEATVTCFDCGTAIKLNDDKGSSKRAIRDTKRSFDHLDRTIKTINRKLRRRSR